VTARESSPRPRARTRAEPPAPLLAGAPPTGGAPSSLRVFLERAPKAEVHVHLEGAVSAAFLEDSAARHGLPWAGRAERELEGRLGFDSFEGFIALFRWLLKEHFRTPEDYRSALLDVAGACSASNVRYAELSISAGALLFFGRPLAEILQALTEAAEQVQAGGGPELRFVADGVQKHGPEALASVLEVVAALPRARWPALGLAGAPGEERVGAFTAVFEEARRRGLAADVHAGEAAGPESVREALDALGADRIVHGVAAARDPALLHELRRRGVAVALNPTSNLRTGAVASLQDFPLRRFLRAGIRVSVNTDDPALFRTSLAGEIESLARTFRLGQSAVEGLVLGGIECALLPEGRKARMLESWGLELERLRVETGLDERLRGCPPRIFDGGAP
jgi:adenosine deaminase